MTDQAPPIDGRVDVTLPSGLRVRGLLPTLNTLARRGLLTSDLYGAVLKAEARPEWLTSEPVDPAETDEKQRLWYAMAAAFPRDRWVDDAWEPWTLTRSGFEELIGEEDKDALLALVQREATAAQVTAVSLYLLGRGPDPAADVDEEVPAETPSDWEPFRDEPGGDAPGPDGGSLGSEPEQHPGDRGRGDRVPRRRGAGHADRDGGAPGDPGSGEEAR